MIGNTRHTFKKKKSQFGQRRLKRCGTYKATQYVLPAANVGPFDVSVDAANAEEVGIRSRISNREVGGVSTRVDSAAGTRPRTQSRTWSGTGTGAQAGHKQLPDRAQHQRPYPAHAPGHCQAL